MFVKIKHIYFIILLHKTGSNDNKIKDIYWKRNMKINSIKAEFYDKNRFEETSDFIKFCYEYPDLSYGFYWLLRARSGCRLDARIAKAEKIIDHDNSNSNNSNSNNINSNNSNSNNSYNNISNRYY
jgi:hypothetical protein